MAEEKSVKMILMSGDRVREVMGTDHIGYYKSLAFSPCYMGSPWRILN